MPIELLPETPSQTAGPYVHMDWLWKPPVLPHVRRKSGINWPSQMPLASTFCCSAMSMMAMAI